MKNDFVKLLGQYKHMLSRQELQTLRGQALSGQQDEALKGLVTILRRNGVPKVVGRCSHADETQTPVQTSRLR